MQGCEDDILCLPVWYIVDPFPASCQCRSGPIYQPGVHKHIVPGIIYHIYKLEAGNQKYMMSYVMISYIMTSYVIRLYVIVCHDVMSYAMIPYAMTYDIMTCSSSSIQHRKKNNSVKFLHMAEIQLPFKGSRNLF